MMTNWQWPFLGSTSIDCVIKNGDDAILVVSSGGEEISEFMMLLENMPPFHNRIKKTKNLILSHSKFRDTFEGSEESFQKPFKESKWFSCPQMTYCWNLLTISNVACVVDTGWAKEKNGVVRSPNLMEIVLRKLWALVWVKFDQL